MLHRASDSSSLRLPTTVSSMRWPRWPTVALRLPSGSVWSELAVLTVAYLPERLRAVAIGVMDAAFRTAKFGGKVIKEFSTGVANATAAIGNYVHKTQWRWRGGPEASGV